MKRDTKVETRKIAQILWRDWDPIGCGVPEDEYDIFVWPVYKLLIEDKPRAEIEAYLRWAADQAVAVSVPEERLRRVVGELMALRLGNTEGKYS